MESTNTTELERENSLSVEIRPTINMNQLNPILEFTKQKIKATMSIKIQKEEIRVLIIYTGGTFGMMSGEHGYVPRKNWLLKRIHANGLFYDKTYSKEHYEEETSVTSQTYLGSRLRYHFHEFPNLIDSSELNSRHYTKVAETIEKNYNDYDSFIIIYGTDTMAYMASQLSFMFENLGKTVVVTGSQIPISEWRNDAEANLIGALTACEHVIPEVTIFFNGKLMRGNRAIKQSSVKLEAFGCPNYPSLADFDVFLDFRKELILSPPSEDKEFKVFKMLERCISVVYIHPLLTSNIFLSAFKRAKAIVLQCYGMGNFPMGRSDLVEIIEDALLKYNKTVVLVSQCKSGFVRSTYASSVELKQKGVILAEDMTIECVIAKLSYVLGKGYKGDDIRTKMLESIRGDVSPQRSLSSTTGADEYFSNEQLLSLGLNKKLDGSPSISLNRVSSILAPLARQGFSTNSDQDCVTPRVTIDRGDVDLNDINRQDEDGYTAIHKAVLQNDNSLVSYLCNQDDVDLNIVDKQGNSPLFYACLLGNKQIAQSLKFEGASLISYIDTLADTLAEKAKVGDLSSIKLYHKSGTDMAVKSQANINIVHAAAEGQQHNVLLYLARSCDKSIFDSVDLEIVDDPNIQQTLRQIIKTSCK